MTARSADTGLCESVLFGSLACSRPAVDLWISGPVGSRQLRRSRCPLAVLSSVWGRFLVRHRQRTHTRAVFHIQTSTLFLPEVLNTHDMCTMLPKIKVPRCAAQPLTRHVWRLTGLSVTRRPQATKGTEHTDGARRPTRRKTIVVLAATEDGVMTERRVSRWYFGGLASCGAACCTHPLDLIKVRQSAGPSTTVQRQWHQTDMVWSDYNFMAFRRHCVV